MRSSLIGEPMHPAMHVVSRLNLQDAPPITSQPMVGLIWSRSTTSSAKRGGKRSSPPSLVSRLLSLVVHRRRKNVEKKKTQTQTTKRNSG
nr:hypothetical protein Iba_chr15bCG8740 [Ipomoea batatas]